MKKNLLIIAATASFILVACEKNDTYRQAVQDDTQLPMAFSAYTGKITKGSNSDKLYDFYNVFSVYGFKTVTRTTQSGDEDQVETVFGNDPVEYFATNEAGNPVYQNSNPASEWFKNGTGFTAGWYYEDVRFWDKLAKKYEFFAVAPYVKDGDNSKEYDVEAGYTNVKIKSAAAPHIISDELNLAVDGNGMPKSDELVYSGFDRDYMVATKITREKPANGAVSTSSVDLEFKHILAKLNVKINLSSEYIGRQELKVNELKINGLAEEGYYVGKTDLTGWAITGTRYARDIKKDCSLTAQTNYNGYYWIETLMFPQEATCKVLGVKPTATDMDDMYLYINYHIGKENYEAYYDFASIWLPTTAQVGDKYTFSQGNEYNLTITVGPEPIKFTASVSAWDPIEGEISF